MPLTTVQSGMMDSIAQYNSFKNRIINGGMQIAQRGTSFSYAAQNYTLDRWSGVGFSSTVSQSTDVPSGFRNSIKVQRPAANTATSPVLISQCIESNNCYDLSSQSVTLSFWAKAGANFSASGSILTTSIYTGTAADQGLATYATWTGVATPLSTALTINTTWTKYTVTGTFGAGVLEAAVFFFYTPVGTAGADDSFYITGVQLEKGSTATSFDYRPYTTELQLCQRYYQMSYPQGVLAGTSGYIGAALPATVAIAASTASNTGTGSLGFKVSMRTVPTVTLYAFDGTINAILKNSSAYRTGVTNVVGVGLAEGFVQFISFNASSATPIAATDTLSCNWVANAEL